MIKGETAIFNDAGGLNDSMFRLSLIGAKATEQRRISALLGPGAAQSDRIDKMDILIEEGERNMFAIENSMQANPYGRSSLNQNSQGGIPYQYNQSFQGTNY